MTRFSLVVAASAALLVTACSKKGGGSAAVAGKTAEAPKVQTVKLPKVGLQIDLSADDIASVGDGMSDHSNMIIGNTPLEIAALDKPETLDDAKDEAKDFNPKNLKDDKLADGWVLTYDNTGSMGANYFVDVVRTIGGKSYKCSTTVSKPEQQQAAVAACKTLRP